MATDRMAVRLRLPVATLRDWWYMPSVGSGPTAERCDLPDDQDKEDDPDRIHTEIVNKALEESERKAREAAVLAEQERREQERREREK